MLYNETIVNNVLIILYVVMVILASCKLHFVFNYKLNKKI